MTGWGRQRADFAFALGFFFLPPRHRARLALCRFEQFRQRVEAVAARNGRGARRASSRDWRRRLLSRSALLALRIFWAVGSGASAPI
jgi:hypothetical protein